MGDDKVRETSLKFIPPEDNSTVAAEIAFMMSVVLIPVIRPLDVKFAKIVIG